MHARIYVSSPYSSVPSSFSGIIDFCPGGSHFWGYFHPPPSVSNFLQIWLYKLLGTQLPFKKTLCLWENIEKCAFANVKHETLKIQTHPRAYQTLGKSDFTNYLGYTRPSKRHSVWKKILKNAHSLISNMKNWKFALQRPLGSPWVDIRLWRFGSEIVYCAPLEWHQTRLDLALALMCLLGSAVLNLVIWS